MLQRIKKAFVLHACCVTICCAAGWVAFANASSLAAGRIYEMVSPIYKGGYGVREIEATSGGPPARVAFWSLGDFAGTPTEGGKPGYVATREAEGWKTEPVKPPASLTPSLSNYDFSPEMGTIYVDGRIGPNLTWAESETDESYLWLHGVGTQDVAANWRQLGPPLILVTEQSSFIRYGGASPGFCNIVFSLTEPPLGVSGGSRENLYDLQDECGGAYSLSTVGVNNKGEAIDSHCIVGLGAREYAQLASQYNAIAAGGSEIFFTTGAASSQAECSVHHQVFVRLGDKRTVEVSKPVEETCVEVPCPLSNKRINSDFAGASEDGSLVYFTTQAQLVGSDVDSNNDLYLAKIGCPAAAPCEAQEKMVTSLTRVTVPVNGGGPADVLGVVRVAPDGSRVYFVARGVLTESANRYNEHPVEGSDNLYVYDANDGSIKFIAELCSGSELSGTSVDLECPFGLGGGGTHNDTSLWGPADSGEGRESQTGGEDGRFLLFTSYGQLTEDDADTARDVFRYDAATGTLVRLSLGEDGYAADGNGPLDAGIARGHLGGESVWQNEMDVRAIADDGARVVFTTAESLSPRAVNGLNNVYEWEQTGAEGQGRVSLISGGMSEENDSEPVISASGTDIFFITSQGLTAADRDGQRDVYDARIGGGFAPPPVQPEPCSGEACQGPLTAATPLLVPGSVLQAPGENLSPPAKAATKAGKVAKPKKAKSKKKGKKAAGRRARRSQARTKRGERR